MSNGLPVPIPPTNLDSTSQSKEFWRGPREFTRDRVTWLEAEKLIQEHDFKISPRSARERELTLYKRLYNHD